MGTFVRDSSRTESAESVSSVEGMPQYWTRAVPVGVCSSAASAARRRCRRQDQSERAHAKGKGGANGPAVTRQDYFSAASFARRSAA
jgi:hypothetical protein